MSYAAAMIDSTGLGSTCAAANPVEIGTRPANDPAAIRIEAALIDDGVGTFVSVGKSAASSFTISLSRPATAVPPQSAASSVEASVGASAGVCGGRTRSSVMGTPSQLMLSSSLSFSSLAMSSNGRGGLKR